MAPCSSAVTLCQLRIVQSVDHRFIKLFRLEKTRKIIMYNCLPSTTSTYLLTTVRDGDPTTYLGSLWITSDPKIGQNPSRLYWLKYCPASCWLYTVWRLKNGKTPASWRPATSSAMHFASPDRHACVPTFQFCTAKCDTELKLQTHKNYLLSQLIILLANTPQ